MSGGDFENARFHREPMGGHGLVVPGGKVYTFGNIKTTNKPRTNFSLTGQAQGRRLALCNNQMPERHYQG